MLISPAYAQSAGGGFGSMASIVPLILIFVIMYFLLIRPQQKKVKQHRAMVEGLRRGDTVQTGGGLIGRITKVRDGNEVEIEISDGVRVRVVRSTIAHVMLKAGEGE